MRFQLLLGAHSDRRRADFICLRFFASPRSLPPKLYIATLPPPLCISSQREHRPRGSVDPDMLMLVPASATTYNIYAANTTQSSLVATLGLLQPGDTLLINPGTCRRRCSRSLFTSLNPWSYCPGLCNLLLKPSEANAIASQAHTITSISISAASLAPAPVRVSLALLPL